MAIAAVATLILNLVLIPIMGMYGAAVSTVVGYLLLAIVAGAVSQRYYPVTWELGRATSILAIAVALSAAALLGPDHVIWRIGCVIAYVPILLGLGIVKISQGRMLLSALRR